MTHSFLYSWLGRSRVDSLGVRLANVTGRDRLDAVEALVTRRSVGWLGVVGVAVVAVAMTGKLGRTFGPTSISSIR